ncbi:FLYWCH-type domain-containing protein [Aphis craccivora]|uniref:FLYWCH-type domain-containing protein n=1 Tax=Aphis craccivora TaxID=307492 RepID=A0A6G0VQ10_APHCR|nr:FLYWCH-type domain-containing protein [Aphis craccivora]
MGMDFITSKRGKKMAVEYGHKYILAYTFSKNVERWRCSNKICPAKRLIEDGKMIKKHDSHNLKNIYYARKKTLPSNPKSLSDMHKALNDLQLTISKNEDFLFINDELSRSVTPAPQVLNFCSKITQDYVTIL